MKKLRKQEVGRRHTLSKGPLMAEKMCLGCGSTDLSLYNSGARGIRLHSRCNDCRNARRREMYDSTAQRDRSLRSRYGMTADEFDRLLASQGGCAACGSPTTDGKFWHIDHDHSCCSGGTSCGKCVRGILCHGCNTGLGNVGDSIERLEKLIDYLERTTVTCG